MHRKTRSWLRRAAAGFLVMATAFALSAAVTATPGGAKSGGKVDKSAVLRFGVPLEDNGGVFFDPTGANATAQSPTNRLFLDLIYGVMILNTPDGKGRAGLATKWSAPDGSTIELTLRTGVKFSDGADFNAAAVKAAWDKLLASGRANLTAEVKSIQQVEVVDDHTIRLHLSAPNAQTLIEGELRNSNQLAVPSPNATNLDSKPVGAGPYEFDSYTTGKLVLKRNPTFYDKASQKLAGIEFIQEGFGQPSVTALQGGTVDLVWQIPPDSVNTIKGQSGLQVIVAPSQRAFTLGLCTTEGPFAKKEARQALQYAIDRKGIDAAALSGTGPPVITPLAPSNPNYNKALAKTYKFDPKKAKSLLKKAGLKSGTSVKALIPSIAPYSTIAEIVQSQLKDVGLNVQLNQTTDFGGSAIREKPDLTVVSLDPTLFTLSFSGDVTALNVCGYKNADITAALTDARDASKTPTEQKAAWDKFQKLELDDSPLVWTNLQGLLAAATTKVKGLEVINSPYGPQLNTVYMTK